MFTSDSLHCATDHDHDASVGEEPGDISQGEYSQLQGEASTEQLRVCVWIVVLSLRKCVCVRVCVWVGGWVGVSVFMSVCMCG